MVPLWLHYLSIASLTLGFTCAGVLAADVIRHPQKMWIMNVVWPVNALYGTLFAAYGYYRYGRLAAKDSKVDSGAETPFRVMVGKGAAHCGSGCSLGDICAEWLVFAFPAIAVWFGWQWLFGEKIFAVWVVDYIFAFGFGIAFQYYTIKPMRDLGPAGALAAAVKADTLSLTAWQVGMYGFMAVAHFWIFGSVIGTRLDAASPEFWFMMQIAMLFGFATSYPVNWWLLRRGIKEPM
jgi:hypothetical protein